MQSLAGESDQVSSPAVLLKMNSALNHDFCPWANRWVYWLKNPLWVLVGSVLISVACGVILNPMAFLLTAILLLVTAIGVAFPWLTMKGIEANVVFDIRRSRVGQPILVRLKVRNRWPWPAWGVSIVRGFALRETNDTEEGVALARIPACSTVEFSWQFVPSLRGLYPLTVPEIETAFPFGMYRSFRPIAAEGAVVVWPETESLNGMPDTGDMDGADEALSDRRMGDHGDMAGTRSFRDGDSLRRVHWGQTARQQRLIVCERQAPVTTAVRVTMDSDALAYGQADNRTRQNHLLEACVRVTASICESLHRQHARVELALGQQVFVAGESAASFNRMMDAIAQYQPSGSASQVSGRKSGDGGFRVFVTTPAGLSRRASLWSGHHVVCVGSESVSRRNWMAVDESESGIRQLAAKWKDACNAR
jgi:uncharacterized protein (DUF58 family)